jgi:starvation-inducible DNA-binding protein
MDKLQQALKIAFASEFSFYLKAHYFHWNVEGVNFQQYHELFGDIYEEVYESIDEFAENIRKARAYTPGSLTRFSMLSAIDDETSVPDSRTMCEELLADSDRMADLFKLTFQLSEQAEEYGLSDFLASRQDAHRKHSWMLRASLK